MKKRSVSLKGHPTSVTLEDEFWNVLKDIAAQKKISIAQLINAIDEDRLKDNMHGLSSAIRIYVLQWALAK